MKILEKLNKVDRRLGFNPNRQITPRAARKWWIWYGVGFLALTTGLLLHTLDVAQPLGSGLIMGGAGPLFTAGILKGRWDALNDRHTSSPHSSPSNPLPPASNDKLHN